MIAQCSALPRHTPGVPFSIQALARKHCHVALRRRVVVQWAPTGRWGLAA